MFKQQISMSRLEATALFALCFILPFNGTIALRMFLLVVIVVLALLKRHREELAWTIEVPLLFWVAIPAISLSWSVDPNLTANELRPDVLYPFLGFLAFRMLSRDLLNYHSALWGAVLGVSAVVLIGVQRGGLSLDYDWYELAHGWGQFSTILLLMIPALFVLFFGAFLQKESKKIVWLIGLGLIIVMGGYAMHNRMFWLAIGLVGIVWSIGAFVHPWLKPYRRQLLIVCLLSGVGLILIFLMVAAGKPANYLDAQHGNSVAATFTHNERYSLWKFWIDRALEKPWLGIGFGHDLPRNTFIAQKPEMWPNLVLAHAHNLFIDLFLQVGLLGLMVFFYAFWALLAKAWEVLRGNASLDQYLAALASISLILGMFAKNMSDDFYTRTPLFVFWCLLGLFLGRLDNKEVR